MVNVLILKCVNTEMLIVLIGICRHFNLFFSYVVCTKKTLDSYKELIVNSSCLS